MYVTVSEVLPRERARWHQQHSKRLAGVAQLVSVLVGFIIMTGVGKYLGKFKTNYVHQKSSNFEMTSVLTETTTKLLI